MHKRSILGLPFFLLLLLAVPLAVPSVAMAQEDDPDEDYPDDDDDDDDIEEDESPRERRAPPKRKRPTREVVKGAYAKINLGPLFWLGDISPFVSSSGTEIDFSFGYDVLDRLKFTLTVEASFFQVISNGDGVSVDLAFGSPIQGDFRIFGGMAAVRAGPNVGGRRVKRLAIAFHAGGGIAYSPPLVDMQSQNVISRIAASYGFIMQGIPLGLVQGGMGLEYYTRLSHFSLGLDVDFNVILGGPVVAMGLATNAFIKYTF